MDLLITGSIEEVKNLGDRFSGCELSLEEDDLDLDVEKVVDKLRGSNVKVVHTPHSKYNKFNEALRFCDDLAYKLDASMVVHSSYIRAIVATDEFNFEDIRVDYGLENYCGLAVPRIEEDIFNKGHDMVLDIAHLYITNPGLYKRNLAYLLHEYPHRISNIHVCGTTATTDHLHPEEGEMNVKRSLRSIYNSNYNKSIVMEVPSELRSECYEWLVSYYEELALE